MKVMEAVLHRNELPLTFYITRKEDYYIYCSKPIENQFLVARDGGNWEK